MAKTPTVAWLCANIHKSAWHLENETRHCWKGYGKLGWSVEPALGGAHYDLKHRGKFVSSAGLTSDAAMWTLEMVARPMSDKPAIVWC